MLGTTDKNSIDSRKPNYMSPTKVSAKKTAFVTTAY